MGDGNEVLLGVGILSWFARERRSDRYGYVFLMEKGDSNSTSAETEYVNIAQRRKGSFGTLKVRVLKTRQSTHVGDWFRGVYPRIPKVGAVLTLGTGRLRYEYEKQFGVMTVGIEPLEHSNTWMDVRALYDVHEQTVELLFEPAPS
jgi:hypothetical protein